MRMYTNFENFQLYRQLQSEYRQIDSHLYILYIIIIIIGIIIYYNKL